MRNLTFDFVGYAILHEEKKFGRINVMMNSLNEFQSKEIEVLGPNFDS